ncbi:MAG: hypothetical protein WD768_06475 [Phycisphaeraceae bacterium]
MNTILRIFPLTATMFVFLGCQCVSSPIDIENYISRFREDSRAHYPLDGYTGNYWYDEAQAEAYAATGETVNGYFFPLLLDSHPRNRELALHVLTLVNGRDSAWMNTVFITDPHEGVGRSAMSRLAKLFPESVAKSLIYDRTSLEDAQIIFARWLIDNHPEVLRTQVSKYLIPSNASK